nr:hypothetical protein [Tanacetum cinerariifolium]
MSVEGVWQGLKVFEKAGVDIDMFYNDTMKNIKRTVRKFGNPLGHSKGIHSKELLGYIEARILIYLPTYKWILENKVSDIVLRLQRAQEIQDIVLLDYDTNEDIFNTRNPLSHAQLIKMYVDNNYPNTDKLLQNLATTIVQLRQPVDEENSDKKKSTKTAGAKKSATSKPRAKKNTNWHLEAQLQDTLSFLSGVERRQGHGSGRRGGRAGASYQHRLESYQIVSRHAYLRGMMERVHTVEVTLDWALLTVVSKLDRFDASWSAIERREGQTLKQLKAIATVRSVGASTRIEGSRMSDAEVEVLLRNTDITKLEDRDSQ